MSAFGGERAGGLRLIRIVLVAVCFGVMLNTAGWVFSLSLNADRVDQINRERAANVQRNCEDINRRHDGSLKALDAILAERLRVASPAERERLRVSRDTTASLIEALVPKRDCALLARQQVQNP